MTTPTMLSTAEYLEQSVRPAHAPAPSHHPQAARPVDGRAAIRQNTAASKAASSGPSGSTQLAAVMPRTGAAFSTSAAHRPAGRPNSAEVTRYINQVVTAN